MTAMFHVPKLPLNYLPRPNESEQLVELLLSEQPGAVGVVGVQGMGGIGKSVTAAVATADARIQEKYRDGIYWLTVGQSPDLVTIQRQLARDVGVPLAEIHFLDAILGRSELENRLAGKAVLLVLDDVWTFEQAERLDVIRPPGRTLITSRNHSVLQSRGAAIHRVGLLTVNESLKLLADWAGHDRAALPSEARDIVGECGYLPLALGMIGAMVRHGPMAWLDALTRLKRHDLANVQARFPGYPYPDLFRAMEASVDGLDDQRLKQRFRCDVRQRYLEMAVFPEDEPIPEAGLAVLWGQAGLELPDVRDLMNELVARSLAQAAGETVRPSDGIRLHDLQSDYLTTVCEDASALHGRLVSAYRTLYPTPFLVNGNDQYFFRHLAFHVAKSHRQGELRALLRDADWLETRLARTDSAELVGDFRWLDVADASDPHAVRELTDLELLHDAIRLSAHALSENPTQLASQLIGRLDSGSAPTLVGLLEQLGRRDRTPWIRPLHSNLIPAGTPLLRTLKGHSSFVNGVAVTPDGRRAISASADETLRVWDLDTGQLLHTLVGHAGFVNSVAVTPDGSQAISASADFTLRVWGLATGELLRTLSGHTGFVNSVAVTPDGIQAISASADRTLRVWHLETAETLRILTDHESIVYTVAVTPDGRHAISGSSSHALVVWDIATGEVVRTLDGHKGKIRAVVVTSDGRRVISASSDHSVRLWDLDTGRTLRVIRGHRGFLPVLAVTPDGTRVLFGAADPYWSLSAVANVIVQDLNDSDANDSARIFLGHSGLLNAIAVAPDNRHAITASADHTVRLWDISRNIPTQVPQGHSQEVVNVAVTPDGRRAITLSYDRAQVWDLNPPRPVHQLEHGHIHYIRNVIVTTDGDRVVSLSNDRLPRIWDLNTGQIVASLEHQDYVCSAAVTPDGRRAITTSEDGALRVWSLETGRLLHRLPFEVHPWTPSAFTLDNRSVLVADRDHALLRVDLDTGVLQRAFGRHPQRVVAIAIASDGHLLISACANEIRILNIENGTLLRTLRLNAAEIMKITPDGRYAISTASDHTLSVWDLDTGRIAHTLPGHRATVSSVRITADGRRAISTSADATVRVWDLKSGTAVATFTGESAIRCCAVASDGATILAGEASGRVHFLRFTEPSLPPLTQPSANLLMQRHGPVPPRMWRRPVNVMTHEFDVGLSFPGEARDYVKAVADEVDTLLGSERCFYDNNYQSQLARPNLDLLLQDIYRNRSRLVVVFLSEAYETKPWCAGVEFRAIRDVIMSRDPQRVMFVRTDDGAVRGTFTLDGAVDARRHSPKEIARMIKERVDLLA